MLLGALVKYSFLLRSDRARWQPITKSIRAVHLDLTMSFIRGISFQIYTTWPITHLVAVICWLFLTSSFSFYLHIGFTKDALKVLSRSSWFKTKKATRVFHPNRFVNIIMKLDGSSQFLLSNLRLAEKEFPYLGTAPLPQIVADIREYR